MENHTLHHITSGPFMPLLPAHTQLKLCTPTQANKMKSAQEFDWLLEDFIQKLKVKVMSSSYNDLQLHSVQCYQPCHHGLDDYGLVNFENFLVMHIIGLPVIEDLNKSLS